MAYPHLIHSGAFHWLFQRITGILIAVVPGIHMGAVHFGAPPWTWKSLLEVLPCGVPDHAPLPHPERFWLMVRITSIATGSEDPLRSGRIVGVSFLIWVRHLGSFRHVKTYLFTTETQRALRK